MEILYCCLEYLCERARKHIGRSSGLCDTCLLKNIEKFPNPNQSIDLYNQNLYKYFHMFCFLFRAQWLRKSLELCPWLYSTHCYYNSVTMGTACLCPKTTGHSQTWLWQLTCTKRYCNFFPMKFYCIGVRVKKLCMYRNLFPIKLQFDASAADNF